MRLFSTRTDAGADLAAALTQWRGADAVVLGIPRGGVVVAAAAARELGLPLAAVAPGLRGVGDRPFGTALVVDDGIATGSTAEAACRTVRGNGPTRIVLAVPVAPRPYAPPNGLCDEYVCPHREWPFWAVGEFYEDFTQTADEEVERLLGHDLPA